MSSRAKLCRVCGDRATAFNFNGLTCDCCKIFFRRNAKNATLKCRRNDNCEIDFNTRKNCAKCRLNKCLSIGMRLKDIRQSYYKKGRPPSNDPSTKNPNLLEILQPNSPIPAVDNETDTQPARRRRDYNLTNYEIQEIEKVNQAMSHFEEETQLPVSGIIEDANKAFNLTGLYARKIVKFCKNIAQFKVLNQTDQFTILKEFFIELTCVRFAFNYDMKRDCARLIASESGGEIFLVPYQLIKSQIYADFMPFHREFMFTLHFAMDNDCTIRNLLIAQFLFRKSENVSCIEFLKYHHIVYCRLLIRYLEAKYQDRKQARDKFAFLMRHLCVKNMHRIRDNLFNILSRIQLNEQTGEILKDVIGLSK